MIILRFFGITLIYIITFIIAKLVEIPVMDMMVIVSFILTTDSIVCKYLMQQYMLAISKELQKPKERDKNE